MKTQPSIMSISIRARMITGRGGGVWPVVVWTAVFQVARSLGVCHPSNNFAVACGRGVMGDWSGAGPKQILLPAALG